MDKKDDNLIYEAYLEKNLKLKLAAILCALGIGSGCTSYQNYDQKYDKDKDLSPLIPSFFINDEQKPKVEKEVASILKNNPTIDNDRVINHIKDKYSDQS